MREAFTGLGTSASQAVRELSEAAARLRETVEAAEALAHARDQVFASQHELLQLHVVVAELLVGQGSKIGEGFHATLQVRGTRAATQ